MSPNDDAGMPPPADTTLSGETVTLTWRDAELFARLTQPSWAGDGCGLLEIELIGPTGTILPVTETGYRAETVEIDSLTQAGGLTAYVMQWLDVAAFGAKYQKHQLTLQQGDLFAEPAKAGDATTVLTPIEIQAVFQDATLSFEGAINRWYRDAQEGRTDEQLIQRLRTELGDYGGQSQCGPTADITIEYTAEGLRIWASRDGLSRHTKKPVLEGKATLAMARLIYAIKDPSSGQLSLL